MQCSVQKSKQNSVQCPDINFNIIWKQCTIILVQSNQKDLEWIRRLYNFTIKSNINIEISRRYSCFQLFISDILKIQYVSNPSLGLCEIIQKKLDFTHLAVFNFYFTNTDKPFDNDRHVILHIIYIYILGFQGPCSSC